MKYAKCRDVKSPSRGTPGSAGIDFYVPNDVKRICLAPGQSANIPSGIRADIPDDHAMIAFNKSGIATKQSLIVGAEVCDSDYQGEIHLHVINVGNKTAFIDPGQKLIQFIVLPVNLVELVQVENTDTILFTANSMRGAGGFGSTGLT